MVKGWLKIIADGIYELLREDYNVADLRSKIEKLEKENAEIKAVNSDLIEINDRWLKYCEEQCEELREEHRKEILKLLLQIDEEKTLREKFQGILKTASESFMTAKEPK